MKMSTVPVLFGLQAAFLIIVARRLHARSVITGGEAGSVYAWVFLLAVWAVATSAFALSRLYASSEFYRLYPGLWLPMVPVLASVGIFAVSRSFRTATASVAREYAMGPLIAIHALRIGALGGLYKATVGLMPAGFTYGVGIPDLLFGLSALLFWIRGWRYGRTPLIVWNLIGLAVIVPSAPVLFQLSLPGPAYRLHGPPDGLALLQFPMVIAPTLVVPVFTLMNALAAGTLWLDHSSVKEAQHVVQNPHA